MNTQIEIKGLDLKIDPAVQELCETSNETSNSTRSALYVLLIVSILALISVLNTSRWNWTQKRIRNIENQIDTTKIARAEAVKRHSPDTAEYNDKIDALKRKLDSKIRNQIENYQTVRIPILGNAFDVNDLGIISGITIFILMIILRFTISREINNLKLALNSISGRYPDDANEDDFAGYLNNAKNTNNPNFDKTAALKLINYTRRKHHYNYLSMNEIFISPPLEIDDSSNKHIRTEQLVMRMFWLPFAIYVLIFLNDLSTVKLGKEISNLNTYCGLFFSALYIFLIAYFSNKCTRQKQDIYKLYSVFKANDYKYIVNIEPRQKV